MMKILRFFPLAALLMTNSAAAEFICNKGSGKTNLRTGPSAKSFSVAANLANGYYIEILDRVKNGEGYEYLKVQFLSAGTGKLETAYIYHEAVSKSCGEEDEYYDDEPGTPTAHNRAQKSPRKQVEPGSIAMKLENGGDQKKRANKIFKMAMKEYKNSNTAMALSEIEKLEAEDLKLLENDDIAFAILLRALIHRDLKNYKKSANYFKEVMSLTDPKNRYDVRKSDIVKLMIANAKFNLGVQLFRGLGVDKDKRVGMILIEAAAGDGDPNAKDLLQKIQKNQNADQDAVRQSEGESNSNPSSDGPKTKEWMQGDTLTIQCVRKPSHFYYVVFQKNGSCHESGSIVSWDCEKIVQNYRNQCP